tara:strand:+ start:2125 stop:2649 length:525 start_codon:yes stop_codon:yes gene_type:complete
MRNLLILIFFFLNLKPTFAENNIVYLDVQYIIDTSELGIFYKKKIQILQDDIKSTLLKKETIIKKKENSINDKKNVLDKDEINKQIKELNNLLNEYKIQRNKLNQNIVDTKKKYTGEILNILNPLVTSYVDDNNINIVIEKKNVLVGIKSLDITTNILKKFNERVKKKNLINEN